MTATLPTIKRIAVLKKHVCFIDPRTNTCWKCRALARYRKDSEIRAERERGGGRKHQRTTLSTERDIARAKRSYAKRKK